jgi:hypothetical protein
LDFAQHLFGPLTDNKPAAGYLDVEVAAKFSLWLPRFSVFCYAFWV